ncbi:cocaine esterase [Peptococcaceae bacterium CEB3]|nr:cocaine esterase [Peptococcaceae bacterium CEB3]
MPRISIGKNIDVSMRDGTRLKCDIYRLDGAGSQPVLLQRLPYGKDNWKTANLLLDPIRAAQAGYTVVIQDTRGKFNSEGNFYCFTAEKQDGYDTVEWCARQSWSNGMIGMYGASYIGATQWLAAGTRPPHLKAIAPTFTASDYHDGWVYQGGAFQLGFCLYWVLSLAFETLMRSVNLGLICEGELTKLLETAERIEELYAHRPLADIPILGSPSPYYAEWLEHPHYDEYWRQIAPKESFKGIDIPVFNIGGWYDLFLGGTLSSYTGLPSEIRMKKRLLIGPWAHGTMGGTYHERDFGPLSSMENIKVDIGSELLRFFNHWLKNEKNGLEKEPPVKLFVMGRNQWLLATDWPLPGTNHVKYFLHSQGQANTLEGDGFIDNICPATELQDTYLYDPVNPVPTVGGQTFLPGVLIDSNAGPRDQKAIETRRDVLCYTSEPLRQQLTVIGPVCGILFASSSARDTDFTMKLVDVFPDGRAFILTEGILRARYRCSQEQDEYLIPETIYKFEVDMLATANVFMEGHRIRVEVSSSNFPRFDANTNAGGKVAEQTTADYVVARNQVYHSEQYSSCVIIPVIKDKWEF